MPLLSRLSPPCCPSRFGVTSLIAARLNLGGVVRIPNRGSAGMYRFFHNEWSVVLGVRRILFVGDWLGRHDPYARSDLGIFLWSSIPRSYSRCRYAIFLGHRCNGALVFCIVSRCLRRLWRAFYGGGGFKCFFRGADLFGPAAAEAVKRKNGVNFKWCGWCTSAAKWHFIVSGKILIFVFKSV